MIDLLKELLVGAAMVGRERPWMLVEYKHSIALDRALFLRTHYDERFYRDERVN